MSDLIIRGLPGSIANDAWWLASDASSEQEKFSQRIDHDAKGRFSVWMLFIFLGLVLLADFLFWQRLIGVSLAMYSAALCAAAMYSLALQFSKRKWALIGALWVSFVLPVVEYTQFTSVSILILGHGGVLIWCAMQSRSFGPVLRNLIRLPFLMALFSGLAGRDVLRELANPTDPKVQLEQSLIWLLPIVASCIFLTLFIGANPVFEQWLDRAAQMEFVHVEPSRMVFWLCLGFAIYPVVAFKGLSQKFKTGSVSSQSQLVKGNAVLNARSITISLVLFNAMFLAQNGTDVAFLWGGAALPDGLTYAEYVHQGAYPLMATSVLAGLFVLVSRRFIPSAPLLKVLLLIWIVQNIFLVFSAVTRLGLYVDAYGLTYLRVRAAIGMALVIAGMALLALQLLANKSNAWVTTVFVCLLSATVYVGCFVNFSDLIARENLARYDKRIDTRYLCGSGPLAVEALLEYAQDNGTFLCRRRVTGQELAPEGWRDWSLRDSRLSRAQQSYTTLLQTRDVTSRRPGFTTEGMEYTE